MGPVQQQEMAAAYVCAISFAHVRGSLMCDTAAGVSLILWPCVAVAEPNTDGNHRQA